MRRSSIKIQDDIIRYLHFLSCSLLEYLVSIISKRRKVATRVRGIPKVEEVLSTRNFCLRLLAWKRGNSSLGIPIYASVLESGWPQWSESGHPFREDLCTMHNVVYSKR